MSAPTLALTDTYGSTVQKLMATAATGAMFTHCTGTHCCVPHCILSDTAAANGTGCNGDGVDVGGAAVMVRAGAASPLDTASASNESVLTLGRNRTVTLPSRPQGWSVRGEDGSTVCNGCEAFSVALNPGDSRLFICQPS